MFPAVGPNCLIAPGICKFFFCSSGAGEGRLVSHILLDRSLILNSKRKEHVLSPEEFALTLSLVVSQTSQM